MLLQNFSLAKQAPIFKKKHHIPEELMARGGPLMDIDEVKTQFVD